MTLQGQWFDGKTSSSRDVELHIDDTGQVRVIDCASHEALAEAPIADIKISSQLGNTPRYLYFPRGEKCETRDHAQVNAWLSRFRPSPWNTLIHQLESHLYFVLLTLVLVVAFSWAMVVYGVPVAARYVAYALPQNVMKTAATETLQLLDKTQLKPTALDEHTQTRLLNHFHSAITQNADLHINVLFRRGGAVGANAFALPDGTVVFTDEIVQLAENDDELLAVLAHEIGHVKYRHSLRAAIQGSAVSFAVATLTGDLSATSHLLAALPLMMTTMSYSRDFEREADDNSLHFLDQHKIARHYFVDLLDRLGFQAECNYLMRAKVNSASASSQSESAELSVNSQEKPDEKTDVAKDEKQEKDEKEKNERAAYVLVDVKAHKEECTQLIAEHKSDGSLDKLMGFFASHPETDERTQKFKKVERQ